MTPRRVVRIYLAITALFNAAMALIWGVNSLFLLSTGLDIFQVMLVNAAFTLGSMIFEIPTGVVADTVGRRISLLLCLGTLFVTTLAYVALGWWRLGFWPFAGVSVFLGLGFTFYTGAVDAWLVDALAKLDPQQPMDPIFARGQVVFGVAMLVGTLAGGALGQVSLFLPYLVRAALVLPAFAVAWLFMEEVGFTPRALDLRQVPAEMRRVFQEGVRYGLKHPVVRPVMFASLVQMTFLIFGFYSWQPYFLKLLGKDLVWVSGLIAALVGGATIVGNVLVAPLSRLIRTRTGLMMASVGAQAVTAVACGLVHSFYAAVAIYLVHSVALGLLMPVKQSYLNAHIPSEQRATIISLDSLFGDAGGAIGQSGWGYLAKVRSIADAWVAGGAVLALGIPFYWLARRRDGTHDVSSGAPSSPSG